MHWGNQDRQEQEAGSRLVWPAPFWIAPGTTRRQTQKSSRARGRRIHYIRMGGSNKWCSRHDLGGNVGTKYQSVCSVLVCALVCSTASTCRILFYSPSPLYSPSLRRCGGGGSYQRIPISSRLVARACSGVQQLFRRLSFRAEPAEKETWTYLSHLDSPFGPGRSTPLPWLA